ncbi:hypothetical protein Tco_1536055 [Tanacetum coccineum]
MGFMEDWETSLQVLRGFVTDITSEFNETKVGMAANLKEFVLTNCDGHEVKSAHDNETLFDIRRHLWNFLLMRGAE